VVKVGDKIQVRVIEVDQNRKRIALTARRGAPSAAMGVGAGQKPPERKAAPREGAQGRRPAEPASAPQKGFKNNPFADFFNKNQ